MKTDKQAKEMPRCGICSEQTQTRFLKCAAASVKAPNNLIYPRVQYRVKFKQSLRTSSSISHPASEQTVFFNVHSCFFCWWHLKKTSTENLCLECLKGAVQCSPALMVKKKSIQTSTEASPIHLFTTFSAICPYPQYVPRLQSTVKIELITRLAFDASMASWLLFVTSRQLNYNSGLLKQVTIRIHGKRIQDDYSWHRPWMSKQMHTFFYSLTLISFP